MLINIIYYKFLVNIFILKKIYFNIIKSSLIINNDWL